MAILLVREGDVVRLGKALGDDVVVRVFIIGAQGDGPLFQLAAAVLRPDIGAAVVLVAEIGAADDDTGLIVPFGVALHVQVLAHDQALHAVQLHIEGILAGHIGGIAAADIVAVVVVLYGVFVVHQGHGAKPGLAVVYPGGEPDAVTLGDGSLLQLADGTLYPVGTGLLDGDVGRGVALTVGAAFVDGLDAAGDRGSDGGVFQQLLGLLQLGLLGLQVQLRFLLTHLGRLDLDGVLQLFIGADLVPLPLQLADLGVVVADAGAELLPLQVQLVGVQLQLVRIVGEQGVALLHILALLHQKLGHFLVTVLLDLHQVFGYHQAGKTVLRRNSGETGDLLHIHSLVLAAAAGEHQTQCQAQGRSRSNRPFHISDPPIWKESFSLSNHTKNGTKSQRGMG